MHRLLGLPCQKGCQQETQSACFAVMCLHTSCPFPVFPLNSFFKASTEGPEALICPIPSAFKELAFCQQLRWLDSPLSSLHLQRSLTSCCSLAAPLFQGLHKTTISFALQTLPSSDAVLMTGQKDYIALSYLTFSG